MSVNAFAGTGENISDRFFLVFKIISLFNLLFNIRILLKVASS